jgi:hypothetical protein
MRLRRQVFIKILSPLLLPGLGLFTVPQTAPANPHDDFLRNLSGAYAFLFSGTVFLPPPFDTFNGPFYRTGEIVADGRGNMVVSYVGNFNGTISRGTFTATYTFSSPNRFLLTIPNTPIPGIPPGIPNVVTMDGVLADNGKIAKCVVSGVSVGGQTQSNIGSVITGEILKE